MAQHRRCTLAKRGLVLTTTAVVLLATAGCDRFSTFDRLGVSTDSDGSIQILYLACDYERLEIVELYDGHDPTSEEDDELLWQIRSEDSARGGVFTVGSRPEGFVETVGFDGQVGENLIASIGIEDSVGAAMSFAPSDLEMGIVQTSDESASGMTTSAFAEHARQSCE